jgi:sugar-specific transcriptional regulator TrmB
MELERLIEIGLTSNEARVYVALTESGRLGANALAKRLQLPRSTIYSVLDSLGAKELIRRESVRGTLWFRIDSPEDLLVWLQNEERHLESRKVVAAKAVKELKSVHRSKSYQAPKVEFYEGKDRVTRFLDANILRWVDSMLAADRSTWGFQDPSFVMEFGPWIKKAWRIIHEENKIAGRILSNPTEIERGLKGQISRREVRVLGTQFDFESSVWILGDYVVNILTRESPIVAFQIQNRTLARNLRTIFKHLYDEASTMG